eukprot:scaffold225807_cov42-Cyclotella_meneghiniana.AAC.2
MTTVPIPQGLRRSSFATDIAHPFRDHMQKYTLEGFTEGYDNFLFTKYSTASQWHLAHQSDEHLHISFNLSATYCSISPPSSHRL